MATATKTAKTKIEKLTLAQVSGLRNLNGGPVLRDRAGRQWKTYEALVGMSLATKKTTAKAVNGVYAINAAGRKALAVAVAG